MKVAVEGCCHGELDTIYGRIHDLEQENQYRVDLLLICGDFQAIRTHADLNCMASPPRHLKLGTFHKYYTGQKVAPILTVVIGGNHEASNYFHELYHGGWLAPNIYYLGAAGVVRFNGLRIAGISGIYKSHDYKLGLYETVPYTRSSLRSIYHTREFDVTRLLHIRSPDVFLSHDWPQSIEHYGDMVELLRQKPTFKPSIEKGDLGSPPLLELLRTLRPPRWFSGHMHVKYEATFHHDQQNPSVNPEVVEPPPPVVTEFLALDQCKPRRPFLEVFAMEVPESHDPPRLTFDPEWLALIRVFNPYLSLSRDMIPLPSSEDLRQQVEESTSWVKDNIGDDKTIDSVQQFVMTSPGPTEGFEGHRYPIPSWYTNPQTVAFCEMLGIEDKVNLPTTGSA